jgi:hypothetical protein
LVIETELSACSRLASSAKVVRERFRGMLLIVEEALPSVMLTFVSLLLNVAIVLDKFAGCIRK